jgi:hypothetical protein
MSGSGTQAFRSASVLMKQIKSRNVAVLHNEALCQECLCACVRAGGGVVVKYCEF